MAKELIKKIRKKLTAIAQPNQLDRSESAKLETGSIDIGSFSIIPLVYEQELDLKYGITLGKLKNGKDVNFRGNLGRNVSFNGGYHQSSEKIQRDILKRYDSVPGFCSMKIDLEEDLLNHVKNIHELSYNHYVWAKKTNLEGKFPSYCCGSSSRNLFLNLMDRGYPNSSFVYNSGQDHAYVALPFVFGKSKNNGFIIVDPTSDQLFKDQEKAPRNNLFVIFGTTWNYETDWRKGNNLYPCEKDNSRFSNLHTLRSKPGSDLYENENISRYFREVFENPIEVNPDQI